MRNIKLTIEYDGTAYHGWQSQINAAAVQDVIISAIDRLTGETVRLTGAGRTDQGVHALGQVANFYTDSSIPAGKFSYALNSVLPDDIIIIKSEEADVEFDSRFSAIGKKYRYLILCSDFPSALLRHRVCHIRYPLDAGAMIEAADCFKGTHDFKAFCASGSSVKTTVRTVTEASVHTGLPDVQFAGCGRIINFEIAGNGFLYNMVRIITGTLIDVGLGKTRPEAVNAIIEGRDRKRAGKTAPAHGLYLVDVIY